MPLEQDKQGGFKLQLGQEIQSGLWPGVFTSRIPLWETGQNIQFTEVGVEKLKGWAQIVTTSNSEPIRGLLQVAEGTAFDVAAVYVGDLTQLYRVNASDNTIEALGTGYNLSSDAGSAVWDSGSSTWDTNTSLWDDGLVQPDHWSMVNYGTFVLATSGADNPLIRKGVGDFVSMYQGVTGVTLTAGGTGYLVGDILTLTGGDGSGATAEVLAVSSGVITSIGMKAGGTGFTTVPTGFSGGTGSGAGFNFTVCDIDVTSVEIFINRGPHVLGFNTSNSAKEFIWCDADDVDTWVTDSTNLAGALQIRELKGPIVAAVPLGSRIAVYGGDQMFLVNYLANDLVFGYQPALNGIGAVSKKSVVSVGRKNYGLSSQGFFVTDGSDFQYIDEPAVRRYFQDNATQGQIAKAVAYHDEENNQIRWYFPTTSISITEGLSYNYKQGVWSIIVNNRSSGDERRVLGSPVTGSETGILYKEGIGENDDSTAMTAWVRSKPMDLGSADQVKEIDSIRVGYEGMGLQYRVGWSEEEHGTITWESYVAKDHGNTFDNIRTAGRYLYLEIYSNTLNADWEVMNVELIGRSEGSR